VSVLLFHMGWYFPVWLSIAIFLAMSFVIAKQFREKRAGVLALLLWLIYALPFIHLVEYLWFDFSQDTSLKLFILEINPYMFEQRIVELTGMIGAVGGIGVGLGIVLSGKLLVRDIGSILNNNRLQRRTLPFIIWLTWVTVGVILSWLAAPKEAIDTAAYTASESAVQGFGFDSAFLISYVILIYSLCDALLENNVKMKALKKITVYCAISFVVVFLQLMRGDRECLPLIVAVALISVYWMAPNRSSHENHLIFTKLLILCGAIMLVALVVGSVRHSLTDGNTIEVVAHHFSMLFVSGLSSVASLMHGTWSGILLTPFSVAGDYIHELCPLRLGKDYWDFFLSIPPGFAAKALGYARPIDSLHGPAWEMRYGGGGTHATVLPFINFRMIGVFLIQALVAYLLTAYEKVILKKVNMLNLAAIGTIVTVLPLWLWYGEKNIINGFIIWAALGCLYRVSLSLLVGSTINRVEVHNTHGCSTSIKGIT